MIRRVILKLFLVTSTFMFCCGITFPYVGVLEAADALIISNIGVDSVSYTSVRIQWNTDIPASLSRVKYDTVATEEPFTNGTANKLSNTSTIHGYTLGGLAPNTLYNFKVCSTVNSIETCSPTQNFTTTAAPSNRFSPPTLPNSATLSSMPTINGTTHTVAADCSDLQIKINTAAATSGSLNHQILIPPTALCKGNYELPSRAGTGWIVVRSAASDAQLPPEGTRVGLSYAPVMPTIYGLVEGETHLQSTIFTENPTSKWRFVGVQIKGSAGRRGSAVHLGRGVSTDIIFDRDIFDISGDTTYTVRNEGVRNIVAHSYIHHVKTGSLAVAIGLTNSQYALIDNNYINAPGISIFGEEGGGNLPPASDITITRNFFEWDSVNKTNTIVRHQLEFKSGERILIRGNIFKDSWTGGITGGMAQVILFFPRAGWSGSIRNSLNYIADVTIKDNVLINTAGGIGLVGSESAGVASDVASTKRFLIKNNIFYKLNGYNGAPGNAVAGSPFYIAGAIEDVVIDHNTIYDPRGLFPATIWFLENVGAGLKLTNNIITQNYTSSIGGFYKNTDYPGQLPVVTNGSAFSTIGGSVRAAPNVDPTLLVQGNLILPGVTDTSSESAYSNPSSFYSLASCTTYWSGFTNNACAGNISTLTANSVTASVGFANTSTFSGLYLASGPYKNSASDGADPGVDINNLNAQVSNTMTGGYVPPPPSDTTPPVFSNISAGTITTDSVMVTWTTNESSDTQVEYGLTASYGSSSTLNATLGSSHSVPLTSLTPNTLYHYRVKSRDGAGNQAISADQTFTTRAVVATVVDPTLNVVTKDFGSLPVGSSTQPFMFSINNPNSSFVGVSAVAVTGDFSITTNYCTSGMQPSTHCDIYVAFNPSTSGTRTGTLIITLTGASTNTLSVTLAGTGTAVNTPEDPPILPPPPVITPPPVVTPPIIPPPQKIPPPGIIITKTLARGMTSPEIIILQTHLKQIGLFENSIQTSNYFGPATERAVKLYQASKGIEQTGIVGPLTRGSLAGSSTPPQTVTSQVLPTTVYIGVKHSDVVKLQNILKRLGFFPQNVDSSGYFGPTTKKAVQAFQRQYTIASSGTENTTGYGMVGKKTWAKLLGL